MNVVGGFHLLWMLPTLAIMVLVVLGVVVLIVRAASGAPVRRPEGPLDILARRFASGEISAEEYQKAKDLLSS